MQSKKPNLFIVYSGIDRCGKGTQVAKSVPWIQSLEIPIAYSHEPNEKNETGAHLKRILEHEIPAPQDPLDMQLMYIEDGIEDIKLRVNPFLEETSGIYLMDRYRLSTFAYGTAMGISTETLVDLWESTAGTFARWPDITILIDIPAEKAIQRIGIAGDKPQFFEKLEFLKRAREAYLSLVDHPKFRGTIFVVNGNRPPDEVFEDIKKILSPRILGTTL